ncbi:hypothetical protein ACFWDI_28310 [Streptomyces sp. NPDC060064]|uniref:hypothetical protein n=1 Tax=Streptomyces sp. NPDC060064 TaxID=3347049 RepID=UPI003687D611
MIRTTYKGRALKILKARGKPDHVKTVINGQIVSHAWQGTEVQALDWFRRRIDKLDENGPSCPADEYPHWWPPTTNTANAGQ